jgi:glutamate dehydrogenase (NADP+)
MPTTIEAIETFKEGGVLHAPGKASNAGGVAVSGLEQSQNAMRISWGGEEVDKRLKDTMENIHHRCVENGGDGEIVNYIDGFNLAGFKKVARAMVTYGAVCVQRILTSRKNPIDDFAVDIRQPEVPTGIPIR